MMRTLESSPANVHLVVPLPLDSGDSGKSRAGERGWLRFSMRVAQVCNECSDECVTCVWNTCGVTSRCGIRVELRLVTR